MIANRPTHTMPSQLRNPGPALKGPARGRRTSRARGGFVTVWVILMVALLTVVLGVVIEITHQWLARVELENALEASALAAVKEWGDANGAGGTLIPRQIGVQFAGLNTINGIPVEIGTNLGTNPTNNPNLNKLCDPQLSDMDPLTPPPDGNLVFGAIYEQNNTLIFDASLKPSCGCICDVIVKATGNQDELANDCGFSVCFQNCQPNNVTVKQLIIELPPGHKPGAHFDNNIDFADCNTPAPPFTATYTPNNNPEVVTVTFTPPLAASNYTCMPFNPLKFGLGLEGFGVDHNCTGGGPAQGNTADQLGQNGVRVTIVFDNNGNEEVCTGVFEDGVQCDLMSIANLTGSTGKDFGVRAQAIVVVKPIFFQFAGIPYGPTHVSVVTTARYRCQTGKPELVRIEKQNVICMPGHGADP